ncbi:MAG TPA: Crp/Fnr family transcriptional regulator [Rhodocyclaceae bacterium]|jgi:CRP-like cAMP-binding protein|nr:Crp/Fnr family transcriptional regulator [Rhodocyclaceae bacterium]
MLLSLQAPSAANRLISALPRKDRQHFLAACEPVQLVFAETLVEPNERIRHVYFPTQGLISLTMPMYGSDSLGIGLVGNEGMLGISLTLGMNGSPLHALVQGGGPAWRMSTRTFRRELTKSPALQRELKHYLYVMMKQIAQTAVCTRFHIVEARLANWLLMTHDRAHADAFHITQEFLARMLGVRRVGITKAATALQNRGLIHYRRGHITILDRDGLEAAACQCYQTNLSTYAQIMSPRSDTRTDRMQQIKAKAE